MSLPELWFGPPPELAADEAFVAHLAANRTQGKRAVGGGLHLTNRRLMFRPNAMESKLGGKSWSCALAEIVSVGVQGRRFALLELFSGALIDRVRFDLRDGRRELFVVDDPEGRAAELRALLRVPAPGAELPAARVIE